MHSSGSTRVKLAVITPLALTVMCAWIEKAKFGSLPCLIKMMWRRSESVMALRVWACRTMPLRVPGDPELFGSAVPQRRAPQEGPSGWPETGEAVEQGAEAHLELGAGEVAPAGVVSTEGEGHGRRGGAGEVEEVGVWELGGVSVGGADQDGDVVTGRDPDPTQHHVV